MEIETTPWYETRSLLAPQIEMLQEDGMIQYKESFLKKESPRYATLKSRFIHYDVNYIKYCFIKEFYQLLFDGVRQEVFKGEDNELSNLIVEAVIEFIQYCQEQSLEENPKELFRSFCKIYLFKLTAKT